MVNVIVGQKGSGKTKELIEAIQSAVKNENGDIVCIEKGNSLRYDVSYRVRLVDAEEYKITNFDQLTGFVSGLHAGNFDITHVFIDNLYKMFEDKSVAGAEDFLDWLDTFSQKEGIQFTLTLSAPIESATERIKKYF